MNGFGGTKEGSDRNNPFVITGREAQSILRSSDNDVRSREEEEKCGRGEAPHEAVSQMGSPH